ncbi:MULTISPECIES: hypothetical protein [Pseudoalteromonas]|mgnify:CR=1 FL=1|uniref:Uncharacterized protein n=1 Tax=Pseudoalteromonas neustonica TaxID=1840331 RepID=A0ABY3FDJ5_9GAMM|nr:MULTISPECIES: hypothetical protein [Pseudoalteromonas]MBB1292846.1 hypothetical protein [Pseudoalteromonas sp. SR41-4]MBB1399527.1 hypothetical protein [Pseudoalteromonas sp. SG44-8]MBB1506492.1 hypothetical protein [Pseudoalteromonas sp. SG41-1]TVU83131.1 hypothetical protein FQP85_10850 [Pseudoalteromonas neustonica]|tara:strand:+ start:244 stop:531 length:288 start_codon:yes stop_codon:yes gene_type:complete
MGVRLAMKKELMGLEGSDFMTADDVRARLNQVAKKASQQPERGFSLISRFNDNHSQLSCGENSKEKLLEFQRHRLFKDVLYTRKSVDAWLNSQVN